MNKRPLSITIIGSLAIIIGALALTADLFAVIRHHGTKQGHDLVELIEMVVTHLLALLGGIYLLRGFNWARWLLLVWMALHVGISLFHPLFELAIHSLMLIALLYFFFRQRATAYFGFRGEAASTPLS
jgi:hypothetical protein